MGNHDALIEMTIELCKHHGLPKISGHFCVECSKSLKAQKETLDKFFNSPKVAKAINSVLNEK